MAYGFKIEVWGDYALFSRPELKVERYSYDVITPSAARGIFESIFWRPAIRYVIDRIFVLNPINVTNIRRNEVKSVISNSNVRTVMNGGKGHLYTNTAVDIQQRASLLLKDVRYVIEAHFVMTDQAGERDNEHKFYAMILRRIRKGQHYSQPYFGCREFTANYRLWEADVVPTCYQGEERDFGFMLYDMDFSNPKDIKPIFFRAIMKDGIVDMTDCEVYQ